MRIKRTLAIATLLVTLALLTLSGLLRGTRSVKARGSETLNSTNTRRIPTALATSKTYSPEPSTSVMTCSPQIVCYTVKPSDTDGHPGLVDCPDGIGCEEDWMEADFNDDQLSRAVDFEHVLALSPASKNSGKLLVFLPGGNGSAAGELYHYFYEVAALQGYHVIGLSYPSGKPSQCRKRLRCYEDYMGEAVTGVDCGTRVGCETSRIDEHPQDSILHRLVSVLNYAKTTYPDDGWERYVTERPVTWSQIHLAGFSNGSSYASLMGTLEPMASMVGRVSLFAGPNDGKGDSEAEWEPARYVRLIAGVTDTRYYGLVHNLNKADGKPVSPFYQVTKNWAAFGMEGPANPPRSNFDPDLSNPTMDFHGAHILVSHDLETSAEEAHTSVVRGRYCLFGGPPDDRDCETVLGEIGYLPAWRCVLGTGDATASTTPVADAGPDQKGACSNGGATFTLDGSRSTDVDCDVLNYVWYGPFGRVTGRNPTVFLPLGTNAITLVVSDGWTSSAPDTVGVVVTDRRPPSLRVTLTPTELSPADHGLVSISATVNVADACGEAAPHVVLTSITSSEPDAGAGAGDLPHDIQEANFGTFDQSFLLRAEAFGSNRRRTYTVTYTATDASGNSKQTSATVHVSRSGSEVGAILSRRTSSSEFKR